MKSAGLAFICLLAVIPCAAGVITAHDYHLGESLWRADDREQRTETANHELQTCPLPRLASGDAGAASGHTIAGDPEPNNGVELVAANADLRWSPGDYAVTHKVYFGTDFNDVNDANEGNLSVYKGNQSQTTYDPCILEFSQTYYWRIDEVNDANTWWKGDVWGFTVWDGPLPCPAGDLVEDCRIDLDDLRVFMEQWLDGCSEPNCADLNGDLVVDFNDFAILAAGWRYKMIIAAHRGSSYTAPENTLAAFNLAWQQDADAVELDVHLSKDNRVMVIHDETTGRTAWGGIDLRVKDTNSDELRSLDVGRWKGEQFAGEKIPFLEEVIDTVPQGKELLVEIKCGTEVLPFVRRIFEDSGKKHQMVVIGFGFWTMVSSKQLMPDVFTYWLLSGVTDEQEKAFWVQLAGSYGLNGIDAHYDMVTDIFIRTVRSAGQGLYTWTVDDPDKANYLKELGVDGITTDRPDWLMEHLE